MTWSRNYARSLLFHSITIPPRWPLVRLPSVRASENFFGTPTAILTSFWVSGTRTDSRAFLSGLVHAKCVFSACWNKMFVAKLYLLKRIRISIHFYSIQPSLKQNKSDISIQTCFLNSSSSAGQFLVLLDNKKLITITTIQLIFPISSPISYIYY